MWLKEVDLTNRVELVNVVAPAELAPALSNGSVGAIVVRQPQVLRLQQQTGAQIIHTWPFRFMSIVKTKLIASQPEALRSRHSLREPLFNIAQNHEQTAKWFGEYLRVDPAIIQQVSQEDPQYGAGKLSDIDISMNTSARAVFAQWAADAYAYKMMPHQDRHQQIVFQAAVILKYRWSYP